MLARRNKIRLTRTALLVTAALAGTALTGCQAYPYSRVENKVFKHFDKMSTQVPKELAPAPKEDTGRNTTVYSYHDGPMGPISSGTSRFVRCEFGAGSKELWVGHTLSRGKKQPCLIGFYARTSDFTFGTDIETEPAVPYVVDEVLMLQEEGSSVVYFKEKGTPAWRRCELGGAGSFTLLDVQRQDCLLQSEPVPAGQVQRYADMANRFYQTYFFIGRTYKKR